MVPQHPLVRADERDTELVREQDVAVREHHHIGDLALAGGIMFIAPRNMTVAHDKDSAPVRLAGVDEVMLCEAFAWHCDWSLGGGSDGKQSECQK
jgi:hypothetical protein